MCKTWSFMAGFFSLSMLFSGFFPVVVVLPIFGLSGTLLWCGFHAFPLSLPLWISSGVTPTLALLWIDNTSRNAWVQVFVLIDIFISVWCLPKTGIAGSHGNFMLNLQRNSQTVFQDGGSIFHSHQQSMRVRAVFLQSFPVYRILNSMKDEKCSRQFISILTQEVSFPFPNGKHFCCLMNRCYQLMNLEY